MLKLCEERVKRFGSRPKPVKVTADNTQQFFDILMSKENDFVLVDLDILASYLGKGEDYFDRHSDVVRYRSIFI
jgi:hypothetical protein